MMTAKELIQISEEREYIRIYDNLGYGFLIQLDNPKLKTKIINLLEYDDDYSLFYWSKYLIIVFSCVKSHGYFKSVLDGKSKTRIPDEMYDKVMFDYMNKSFKKFNEKYDDIQIEGNTIKDTRLIKLEELRQNEINEFVESISCDMNDKEMVR